jgi:hypothetical protein
MLGALMLFGSRGIHDPIGRRRPAHIVRKPHPTGQPAEISTGISGLDAAALDAFAEMSRDP